MSAFFAKPANFLSGSSRAGFHAMDGAKSLKNLQVRKPMDKSLVSAHCRIHK
jgi:hypothetical protein